MQQQVLIRTREMQRVEARHGQAIDALLRGLYIDDGLTLEEVGARLGITKGAVSRWLVVCGIEARRPGSRTAA